MALFSWVKRYVRIVNTIIKDAGVIRITTYHQQNVIARSSFFFSQNTTNEKRGEFLSILGPMQDSRHGKYLGLPSVIRKSKIQVFAKIKGKVAKKLSGWKEKNVVFGWEGNPNQGGCTSDPNVYNELLPFTKGIMVRTWK